MEGVRIKMPLEMFKKYPSKDFPEYGLEASHGGKFAVPFEKSLLQNHIVMPYVANKFYRIEYTDDQQLLQQPLYTRKADGSHSIAFRELGKYKSSYWTFQSEWRLKLVITPGIPLPKDFSSNKDSMDNYLSEASRVIFGKNLGFDEYYLDLDEDAFKQMEITLGPKQHTGDRILVEALLNEYNPSARILDSKLLGKVK